MKNRIKFDSIGLVGLLLIIGAGVVQAQSENGALSKPDGRQKRRVTAALMFSGGESAICQKGNINDAYVVTISIMGKPKLTTYVSGIAVGCTILPLMVPVGTQITVTGVLQDTAAIPGGEISDSVAPTIEDCFNIEGYSVGLAANSTSEFDPTDPNNIINAQGYGFFWYDSDSDLKPGPYGYKVVGCARHDCPARTVYYNSDPVSGTAPPCTVLNADLTGDHKNFE